MTKAKANPNSPVRNCRGAPSPSALGLWMLALSLLTALPAAAQTPLSNLVFTVGTTIQDGGGHNWSYVLIGAPQPLLLAGKRFAIFGKPGFPTNAGSFTLRGTIFQQSDPNAINTLLTQSLALGENLTSLSNALNTLLHKVPGITNLALPQKILAGFQAAQSNANTAQFLGLLAHVNPGLTMCAGQAFAEQITGVTTYEVREVNLATGAAGDALGRITITPGAPTVLPAPGYPFQVVTNDPSDHLRIRLRWGTPPELRRLSLLGFGYNLWRIPITNALAAGYNTTPPTLSQLYSDNHFTLANSAPVMAAKDFSTGHGAGAADDPADPTTYFFSDDNGHAFGLPPFTDGAQFYYFVTARDVLGRDELVSPGGLAEACRRLRPQAPANLRVQNVLHVLTVGITKTNQQSFLLNWQQNTNTNDQVTEYWVYRWPNPAMALTNDAAPLSNRVGVIAQALGTNVNSFLDVTNNAPLVPGLSNYWYTVRAVSQAACAPLLSPHTPPAWGVLRERFGPPGTTGALLGSCGSPAVMFLNFNTLTNPGSADVFHWTYRFTCQRRDPGIAWVQFFATNQFGVADTIGPLYFPPDGNVVQANYSLTVSGTNDLASVACVVGTFYGLMSPPAATSFPAAPLPNQRLEAVFLTGELLLTALSSSDPLVAGIVSPNSCVPGFGAKAYPDGTLSMRFDTGSGTPLLIQVNTNSNPLTGAQWVDIGVVTPDTNNVYWVFYPDCPLDPLPPFRGCRVNLPGESNCYQHVSRAGDNGPVAPIHIRFVLTPRTHEYRLYRSVNDGPLTLIGQGAAVYDPLNSGRTLVRTDDAMPPSAAHLCYFVQLLDEHGNGSPMVLIGCKEVKPAKLPRPVLAEPQPAGDNNNPHAVLNWFCPTAGVYRFEVKIERADQPGSGKPSGLTSSQLTVLNPFNSAAHYYGLFQEISIVAHFDEAQLTPPVGASFGPGPQFTLTANVQTNVPYHISVAAMDNQGNAGDSSQVWTFIWKPTNAPPTVPWPARPLPPSKSFDEDQYAGTNGAFLPRVAAVLMLNPNLQLDQRFPVGIRVGDFSSINPSPQTVGTSNLISYVVAAVLGVAFFPPPADPHTLVFRRQSQDPTHKGESLLPIVVYRQQVTNAAFPRVSDTVTQVTPLLERIPYSTAVCPNCQPPGTAVNIYDRLLAAGAELDSRHDALGHFLYLRDQQPVQIGATYQYFVVRLNDQRDIAEIIPAGTVTIPSNP